MYLRSATRFISLLLIANFIASPLASAQASRSKKTAKNSQAAKPTNGSPKTFTLNVDQNYCDVSLPYSYQSTRDKVTLNIGNTSNGNTQRDTAKWSGALDDDWKKMATPSASVTVNFDTKATSWPQGGKDDAPADTWLNDNGGPILTDPKNELSTNTFDVQRLLVRTLFGPNPFQVACAYPYLKYPKADASDQVLHTGVNGKEIPLVTSGAGYYFSLNGKNAPKYYLINIVRWQNATAPKAPTGASTANKPFFQASSDNWYLLNYSDSQDRQQDITKMFYKITPALVSDTLRIIGSDKVMFLGIHLAPLPVLPAADAKPPGVLNPNPSAGPATEQAWFDNVSLKYTFEATAATPTNMADLGTLIQIVLRGTGISSTGLTTNALNAGAAPPPPPSVRDLVKELQSALDRLNLDSFLQQRPYKTADAIINRDYGVNEPSVALLTTNDNSLSFDPTVEGELTKLSDNDPRAIAAITQDLDAVSRLQASFNGAEPTLLLSTYQGRYAAGLLTNLTNLPVNLASNWSATFTSSPVTQDWARNAGVYDLTVPYANAVDMSNRPDAPEKPAPAAAGTATTKPSTICTVSLTTDANPAQSPCSDQANKILDEGRHYWDVSFIVPLTGFQDLNFQSNTSGPNLITAKTITRQNAYGVFDLFMIPEDLTNPPFVGIPHVVVGLPFAGQVFNKPYFAVGETLNFPKVLSKISFVSKLPVIGSLAQKDLPLFVRPVFGWVYNKEFTPGTDPRSYRSLKPQWALEMSFSSIKNAVQTFGKSPANAAAKTNNSNPPSTVPSTK